MPNAKPLILLFCWFAVAMVTGVAIGLYPAFNIKLEPLDDVKELRCKAVITKELELIDESEQVHAGLGLEDNNIPILYMKNLPDGPRLDCSPNEIIIKNDKRICGLFASNNRDRGAYGLGFITFGNKLITNIFLCTNPKGSSSFVLSGENISLVSVIALASNNPGMEILKSKNPMQLLSINCGPSSGSEIYLEYPDQDITFPYKKDNAANPSRNYQSLLEK